MGLMSGVAVKTPLGSCFGDLVLFLITAPCKVHRGRQQVAAQVAKSQSSTWETWMEFQAVSFSLVQPRLLQAFGEGNIKWEISLSLLECICV